MRAAKAILPAVLFVGLCGMTACSSARAVSGTENDVRTLASGTVGGVGQLPGPLTSFSDDPTLGATTTSENRPGVTSDVVVPLQIGVSAKGPRLLIIGDSILASISRRYGGEACNTLVPLGWQVEVDAETGRFIEFGKEVLDRRLDAGWDAAVILLGNNYNSNQADFQGKLSRMVERLAPSPVALLTTMPFRGVQTEVNQAIRTVAAFNKNATIVDWGSVSGDDLTGHDRLHLTDSGRQVLADTLALSVGIAPFGSVGKCLDTKYRDDSAGSPTGPAGNIPPPKKSSSNSSSTPTTTPTKTSTGVTTPLNGTTGASPTTVKSFTTTPPATNPSQPTTPQPTPTQPTTPQPTPTQPPPPTTQPPQPPTT